MEKAGDVNLGFRVEGIVFEKRNRVSIGATTKINPKT